MRRSRRRFPSDDEVYKPILNPGIWNATLLLGCIVAVAIAGGWLVVRGLL